MNRFTVPPYKSVELTKLSPDWHTFIIANVDAACPEPTVTAASPPSSAATLFSSTSLVGFIILVYMFPNSFSANKFAAWSVSLNW